MSGEESRSLAPTLGVWLPGVPVSGFQAPPRLSTKVLLYYRGPAGRKWERKGNRTASGISLTTSLAQASSAAHCLVFRQLRCIAYSCSRVSGSEAVQRRSSSDFIHSWYLQGQRGSLQQAGPIQA